MPDFGVQDTSLIESIIGGKNIGAGKNGDNHQDSNEKEESPSRPQSSSLWWLFYDCIARFPKFEQLKNFINESHRLKEFQNDKQRKKKIDEYFAKLKKQN